MNQIHIAYHKRTCVLWGLLIYILGFLAAGGVNTAIASSSIPPLSGSSRASLLANATQHSGALISDETWSNAVLLTGDVTVPAGVKLTIMPGTVIFFKAGSDDQSGGDYPEKVELLINGCLDSQGNDIQPLYFTSDGANPAPADWGQIKLSASSPSIISYSRIEYAARGIYSISNLALTISSNTIVYNSEFGISNWFTTEPITIDNNSIEYNLGDGIFLYYAHPEVKGNYIAHNSGSGISFHYYASPKITNNTITDNGVNGLLLGGGYGSSPVIKNNLLSGNGSYDVYNADMFDYDATNNYWGTQDPLLIGAKIYDFNDNSWNGSVAFSSDTVSGEEHISGNVTWSGVRQVTSNIWIDTGATLTIEAGTTVKFAGGYGIFNHGELRVLGTAAAQVLFTTASETPAAGAWGTIKFNFARGELNYARIQYAQHGLTLFDSEVAVNNCYIGRNLNYGVYSFLNYRNSSFTGCTITENGKDGMNLFYSHPRIENTTISRNGENGILAGYYSSPVITCSQIIDNALDGLLVAGYDSSASINDSSIYGNGSYSVRLGTPAGARDFDATNNFWGTTDESAIAASIYDHYDNPGVGIVDFSNYQGSTPSCCTIQANAGPDQTVNEGTAVTLDGSASAGHGLAYQWSQIAGPQALLADPTSPTPSFVAPQLPGGFGSQTLTFQLTVSSGIQSSTDFVDIAVKNINQPPVATLGPSQTVKEGSSVMLFGSDSYDPDNDPITYQWVQTSGTMVALTGENTATPTFAAPFLEGGLGGSSILTFSLTISDGSFSDAASVNIYVEQVNHAPVASAGSPQTVRPESIVTLDGTGSSDPDGDLLMYQWAQVEGPYIQLSNATTAQPTFQAPHVLGTIQLIFSLTVSDRDLTSPQALVVITVKNSPPLCELARPDIVSLWPPNHRLVQVRIVDVTDPDDTNLMLTVTLVTQDEPVNSTGDGDTNPDAILQNDKLLLRAERDGQGDGRVYEIHFTADDREGGICAGSVKVDVPHSKKAVSINSGQLYESTRP